MSLYFNLTTQEIREVSDALVANWLTNANPKASLWRPYFVDAIPTFNASTHKLTSSIVISPVEVRKTWAVVALSAEELEEIDAATQLAQIQAVLADLRNGTGTTAQRLARCERVCAQLIKRLALKGILP